MSRVVEVPAATRRWTRVEYERLIELGVFRPGERLELVDGLLLVREPQGSRHAATIRRVVAALRGVFGDGWQVDAQLPIALDDSSEPEPDVSVVASDPRAYRDAHPTRAALIVEIAGTSYRVDREYKAGLYARAGIPEYWIVDLFRETLEVHREPGTTTVGELGWRYQNVSVLRPPALVTPLAVPGRSVAVSDLLP